MTTMSKSILVVEDEFLIALDIAGALEQAGMSVVGPHSTVDEALLALKHNQVNGALLDASLAGAAVNPVAAALYARGIPFAFVTGHGREYLPPEYRTAPLVRKPFTNQDILGVVAGF